jgi:error-prone DNA polymerase
MTLGEQVVADYDSVGISLKAHPVQLLREELRRLRVARISEATARPHGTIVRVAGLVLLRQHPTTAKGTIFMTLEDETGAANLVIWPRVWDCFRPLARSAVGLIAQGQIERSGQVVHLVVAKLEDLSKALEGIPARSRDFR